MSITAADPCREQLAAGVEPDSPCARRAEPWVLLACVLGSGMAFADGTVVNLALAEFQADFGATLAEAQWTVESYMLVLASALLVGGALGDRFGRQRVFALGVGLFALASLACGLARTVEQLILARGAQGFGAAMLVPGSLALISASFPADRRGGAIGVWSAFSAVSAGLGLLAGGLLIDLVSWRWVFFANLPLAAAVIAVCRLRVPESRAGVSRGPLDWPGALLATLALTALTFGLLEAPTSGWGDARVTVGVAAGLAFAGAFCLREATTAAPMLPFGLFRSRDLTVANLLTVLLYGALGGGLVFLPLNLIQVQGYTKTEAGAANLPFIVLIAVLSRRAGRWVDRLGPRPLLVAGPLAVAAAYAALAVPAVGGSYWATFFPGLVLLGLGMAVTVTPLTATVMNSVAEARVGLASGVNNAASRVAQVLAIALFGPLIVGVFAADLGRRLADAGLSEPARREVLSRAADLGALEPPPALTAAEREAVAAAVKDSFVAGFRAVALTCSGLCLLSAAAAGFGLRPRD